MYLYCHVFYAELVYLAVTLLNVLLAKCKYQFYSYHLQFHPVKSNKNSGGLFRSDIIKQYAGVAACKYQYNEFVSFISSHGPKHADEFVNETYAINMNESTINNYLRHYSNIAHVRPGV